MAHEHDVAKFIHDWWQFFLGLGSAFLAAGVWVLRQIFATKEAVRTMVDEHEKRENEKLDKFESENRRVHDDIQDAQKETNRDIRWIKNHLVQKALDEDMHTHDYDDEDCG